MSGLMLDFSKFVHATDKFFPSGRLFLEEDERGHFVAVETSFVFDGKPEEIRKWSFHDRGPDAIKQFALLKTYCQMAKESAIERLHTIDPNGSGSAYYPLSHQMSNAEFGSEIFDKAINNTFISDWSAV